MAKDGPADKFPWDTENLDAFDALKKGDDEPLIALLEETGRPLHPELRRWLAAMFKGNTEVRWWLKRHPGFQKTDDGKLLVRGMCIGHRVHELWHQRVPITKAIAQAVEEFGLEERTIQGAWAEYRQLYWRAKDAGDDLAEGLRPLRKRNKQSKGE